MTREELQQLITDVQKRQSELANVEVKAARSGTPRRLYESLSAFANCTGGGVLFGIDESSDFSIVGVGDAQRLQEDITHLASSEMEPALRPSFLVDEIDDGTVVAVEIDEIPAAQKPCFYEPAGLPKGAYLRVGNTNRQMTEDEVFGYLSSRGQPTYDEEVIANATIRDLDNRLLDEYLPILRQTRPGAGFLGGERDEVLMRLHAVAQDGEIMRPTLAGLLMFGKYPQEFLPQLMVTFVQYFGTTEEECTPHGARFVDSRRFEGPIPEMVKQAETYVRGSYIQIRMFADRLEIQSPGGLFGNVTVENLEEEHSTRNARLMRMMEDMHVVENRGSGIRAMLQAMREANLEPPRFDPPGIVAAEFGLLAISGFWRHGCWGFFAQPSALATSSSTPNL